MYPDQYAEFTKELAYLCGTLLPLEDSTPYHIYTQRLERRFYTVRDDVRWVISWNEMAQMRDQLVYQIITDFLTCWPNWADSTPLFDLSHLQGSDLTDPEKVLSAWRKMLWIMGVSILSQCHFNNETPLIFWVPLRYYVSGFSGLQTIETFLLSDSIIARYFRNVQIYSTPHITDYIYVLAHPKLRFGYTRQWESPYLRYHFQYTFFPNVVAQIKLQLTPEDYAYSRDVIRSRESVDSDQQILDPFKIAPNSPRLPVVQMKTDKIFL